MKKILTSLFLAAFAIFSISAQDLKQGLAAHFSFDGDANDASGNGNHGSVNGAVPVSDRNGKKNAAYLFDGINDYISLPASALNNLGNCTMAFWIKLESNSFGTLISKQHNAVNSTAISIGYLPSDPKNIRNGRVTFYLSNQSNNESIEGLETSKYYHLAFSYSNRNIKTYLNGQLINEKSGSYNIPNDNSPTATTIGAWLGDGGGKYFNGIMDDVKIYNRVLSDGEVKALYGGEQNEAKVYKETVYISNNELNIYDNVYNIDLTPDQCNAEHILVSPDQSQLFVKLNEKNVGIYSIATGNKIGGFTNPSKSNMLFAFAHFFGNFLYLALSDSEKFLKIDLASGEVTEVKCKKTPMGCVGNVERYSGFHSLYEDKTLKIKEYLIELIGCHIAISKTNPEKKAFAEVVSGNIDDCISFLNNYPNSSRRSKVQDLMLSKSEGTIEGYAKLCAKYTGVCEQAEGFAFKIANEGNKEIKQLYLSKFSTGKNKDIVQSQVDAISVEEKRKAEETKKAEEKRQENARKEAQVREDEARKMAEEARKAKLQQDLKYACANNDATEIQKMLNEGALLDPLSFDEMLVVTKIFPTRLNKDMLYNKFSLWKQYEPLLNILPEYSSILEEKAYINLQNNAEKKDWCYSCCETYLKLFKKNPAHIRNVEEWRRFAHDSEIAESNRKAAEQKNEAAAAERRSAQAAADRQRQKDQPCKVKKLETTSKSGSFGGESTHYNFRTKQADGYARYFFIEEQDDNSRPYYWLYETNETFRDKGFTLNSYDYDEVFKMMLKQCGCENYVNE